MSPRDPTAGAGNLGDDDGPVLADLADGKAQAGKVGHVLVARIGKVSARDLPGTFEQMPDERGLAEPVPVIQPPAKLMNERSDEERGIGSPAGDDDVGAVGERLRDGLCSDVGIGRYDPVAELGSGGSCFLHAIGPAGQMAAGRRRR